MGAHLGYGTPAYDVAHLLGAAVLVLSFVLLYQRRVGAMINAYAAQAWVLTAAAVWQGWVQGAPQLYLTGLLTLGANGVAIPLALHAIVRRLRVQRSIDAAMGVFASMALGGFMVALSIMVVLPTTAHSGSLAREDLALALSVVLLGLLVLISRRSALTQVIGVLSLENGLILAAIGVDGMPLVVELAVAVLVVLAFMVFGVFFFRLRARFDSLDVAHLDRVGGQHR